MSNRVVKPILSARAVALVSAMFGTYLVACQSAPVTSKEPASKEAAPGAASTAPNAVKNTALPNQAAAQAPQGSAPATAPPEPAAVKLTGSPSPQAGVEGAAAPQADKAPKPGEKGSADKGAADKGAADKAADAKAAAGKTVQGNVVSEEPFSTWLQVTSPAKAGAPVQLEAVLVAKAPYHCNAEYPHKFKLNAAPAGLAYPEETVRGMKVSPERSVLTIPVNAQSAGKPTVAGTLSFSVCTEERCLVEKRELSVALDVM